MRRGNAGLNFTFHIKNDKGCILSTSFTPLQLNTDIFYDYRSATPFVPLSPLKEKNAPVQAKLLFPTWLTINILLV